jgi:hypothetical protein
MMLEWGWDKYLDSKGVLQQTGNTIIEDEWFKTNGTTQLQMLTSIQKKRRDYQGNYDGFFGKVSNFTWNFNPDGSYDISIDLITLGDVIESLKVNTSVKAKYYPDGGLFEDIKFEEGNKLFNTNIAKIATLNTLGYFLYKKIEEISNGKVGDKNSYIEFDINNDTSYQSPQYYVRLGEFLTQLEGLIVPVVQNNNSNKFSQITFEKFGCLISYFPNQISLDPRVCIFKPSLNSYGDITGVVNPTYFNNIPISYLASIDNVTYGLLMNLYINFEFIAGLLVANGGPDQQLSLYKFLQDLCNGINNALGGVNKLEPVIKEDYKITIIDQTLSFPEDKDTVSLEVYGYNPSNLDDDGNPSPVSNFVKDVKFVSKITPQLASMISIGATAAGSSTSEIDGTAFSKWSEGLVDRFAEKISEPNGLDLIAEQEQVEKTRKKYAERFRNFYLADKSVGSSFEEAVESTLSTFANIRLAVNTFFGTENRTDNFYGTSAAETAATFEALDNDLNEKRIVADGYSGIYGEMFFEEYLRRSIEAEENDIKNQTFDQNTISQLTSTNYAIYLIKAFGGISGEIKIRFFENTPNQIITGLGSQTSFTSRTATVENLQVDVNQSRYLEFDDVFISQGKSAYKAYINTLNANRYTETKTPSSEIGFIPLSFELVLDGISGIKMYNKLKINNEFLPSNYPESLSFIITKVNHNISNNSWDTSLSTISIPKTQPYELISTDSTTPSPTTSEGISNTLVQNQEFKGLLQPLKNMVGAYESNSSYDIANIGGSAKISRTKVLNLSFSELKKFQSLPEGDPNRIFAAGKYQIIPQTLYGSKDWKQNVNGGLYRKLGLTQNDKFSAEIQEKIGDGLFLEIRKDAGNYLSGKNSGTEADLEAAIQGIGQEFASMPVIYSKTNQKVGDVRTGSGQAGFYGGTGANPSQSKLGVKEMARVLIQTRINYSNKAPVFIPIYFNL